MNMMENVNTSVIEDGNLIITIRGYGDRVGIARLQEALTFAIVQAGLSDRLDRSLPIAELEHLLKIISLDEVELNTLFTSKDKLDKLQSTIEESCEGVHEDSIKNLIQEYRIKHNLESDPNLDYIEKARKYDQMIYTHED